MRQTSSYTIWTSSEDIRTNILTSGPTQWYTVDIMHIRFFPGSKPFWSITMTPTLLLVFLLYT